MSEHNKKFIYIVISKTNTALGKCIQKKLGVNYNHCSISLDESLENIFSFGRKEIHNIFRAGFVKESKNDGFFGKYNNSNIVVLKVPVTETQWDQVNEFLGQFKKQRSQYKYSLLGLIYCYFGIPVKRKNKYFCSQFVAELLQQSGIQLFDKDESLVRPHDFLSLKAGQVVYMGEIGNYCAA